MEDNHNYYVSENKILVHNDCGVLKFGEGTIEKFIEHALARGRHADLGLADEQIATKAFDVIKQNQALLKVGDNTLTGTINGIEKSFKAFVKDSKIISVNMYPGISGRITQGTIIDYGNLIW